MPPTNGLAIASLVASLVWACGLGSVAAVVLGVMAHRQIRERGEGGSGLATAGIVLGGLGVLAVLAFLTAVLVGVSGESYGTFEVDTVEVEPR